MGDGGGGHRLVRMEWRPAGWSVCLPLLIFPCTIKSRSSLLAPAHPGGPGKRAVKRLCVLMAPYPSQTGRVSNTKKFCQTDPYLCGHYPILESPQSRPHWHLSSRPASNYRSAVCLWLADTAHFDHAHLTGQPVSIIGQLTPPTTLWNC